VAVTTVAAIMTGEDATTALIATTATVIATIGTTDETGTGIIDIGPEMTVTEGVGAEEIETATRLDEISVTGETEEAPPQALEDATALSHLVLAAQMPLEKVVVGEEATRRLLVRPYLDATTMQS